MMVISRAGSPRAAADGQRRHRVGGGDRRAQRHPRRQARARHEQAEADAAASELASTSPMDRLMTTRRFRRMASSEELSAAL